MLVKSVYERVKTPKLQQPPVALSNPMAGDYHISVLFISFYSFFLLCLAFSVLCLAFSVSLWPHPFSPTHSLSRPPSCSMFYPFLFLSLSLSLSLFFFSLSLSLYFSLSF